MAEIITVERRRRGSDEDKRRIVAETFEPGTTVSSVAKRHGLYPGQVFGWRRALRDGVIGRAVAPGSAEFAPVIVRELAEDRSCPTSSEGARPTSASGRIEIILGRDRRVVVGADVDASALRRVLDVLERR